MKTYESMIWKSERKDTWFIEAIPCLIRTCNNTGLKTQQLTREIPRQNHHPSERCFQAVTPSSCPPLHSWKLSAWGPSVKHFPGGCPLPTPRATSVLSKLLKHIWACKLHLSAVLSDWWKPVPPHSGVCSALPDLPVLLLTPEPCNVVVQGQPQDTRAPETVHTNTVLSILTFKTVLKQKELSQDAADSAYPSR